MLKKTLIVVAALLMVSPAFGGWSTINQGAIQVDRDDDGKILGFSDGYNLPNDRTVDWERDGDYRQRKAEVWNWPASYDYVPVCNIPVRMEIGFWIKLKGCSDAKINLKQVAINKYQGQVTCKAWANVATQWSGDWVKTHSIPANKDYLYVTDSSSGTSGSVTFGDKISNQSLYIRLGLKDVNLENVAPTNSAVEIGYVTVKVRPAVRPNQYMGGLDANGSGFGSATYQYYAPPTGL